MILSRDSDDTKKCNNYVIVIAQSTQIYCSRNKPCPRDKALGPGLFTAINPRQLCNSCYNNIPSAFCLVHGHLRVAHGTHIMALRNE